MVAIINWGSSLRRAFQYNENKLEEGAASILTTQNYPYPDEDMNTNRRLNLLQKLAGLREDVLVNSVHISLNFAPDEQLSDAMMTTIAKEYMDKIGFGAQPFLIYRHNDSGHPHCHIVTTNIELDGSRISLHNIGRERSEPARKELEIKYGLVKAEDHRKDLIALKPIDASKLQYGKAETKRSIGNILDNVLDQYKYTTLAELNAVLRLYNVTAERGAEDSRVYAHRGLLYHVLDTEGNPVGVPIKASLFHNRPTLNFIENKFLKNDVARQAHKAKIKSTIDFTLTSKRPRTLAELEDYLRRSGIKMVLRQNDQGLVYGITYIDFKTKCVFNGSALGKAYSAKGLTERMGLHEASADKTNVLNKENNRNSGDNTAEISPKNLSQQEVGMPESNNEKTLIDLLLQHEYASNAVPFEWKKKKKRKKKR